MQVRWRLAYVATSVRRLVLLLRTCVRNHGGMRSGEG
jgi:hypothetical protein